MTQDDNDAAPVPPAAAAAAAAASTADSSSPSIAQALYAVETLVQVFGFSPDAANEAVNQVGIDTMQCCQYILDRGLGKDTGGTVLPIDNCPHVARANSEKLTTAATMTADIFDWACQYHALVDDDKNKLTGKLKEELEPTMQCPMGENWLCLTCNQVFCSRYVNGHGLEHWKDTQKAAAAGESSSSDGATAAGHCVAVSLADLSVWCHICSNYVVNASLKPMLKELESLKFPTNDSAGIENT